MKPDRKKAKRVNARVAGVAPRGIETVRLVGVERLLHERRYRQDPADAARRHLAARAPRRRARSTSATRPWSTASAATRSRHTHPPLQRFKRLDLSLIQMHCLAVLYLSRALRVEQRRKAISIQSSRATRHLGAFGAQSRVRISTSVARSQATARTNSRSQTPLEHLHRRRFASTSSSIYCCSWQEICHL